MNQKQFKVKLKIDILPHKKGEELIATYYPNVEMYIHREDESTVFVMHKDDVEIIKYMGEEITPDTHSITTISYMTIDEILRKYPIGVVADAIRRFKSLDNNKESESQEVKQFINEYCDHIGDNDPLIKSSMMLMYYWMKKNRR